MPLSTKIPFQNTNFPPKSKGYENLDLSPKLQGYYNNGYTTLWILLQKHLAK